MNTHTPRTKRWHAVRSQRRKLLEVLLAFCEPGTERLALAGPAAALSRTSQPGFSPDGPIGKGGVPGLDFIAQALRVFRII